MKRLLLLSALGLTFAPIGAHAETDLSCTSAPAVAADCVAGAITDRDACLYADVISRACTTGRAPDMGLVAASTPGSGFLSGTSTVWFRRDPGSREDTATGDLSADPWAVNCRGKSGGDYAACLRSRFLTGSPDVCAEWARAFGVDTCGIPGGGWSRGPGNERWGSAQQALDWFCENDPAVIGSPGRAGGYDCVSTGLERARLGAHGGEPLVTEWQRRSQEPPPPPPPASNCLAPKVCIDPPASCPACPVCPVCAPLPTLPPKARATFEQVCRWIPAARTTRRHRCLEALTQIRTALGEPK